MIDEIVSLGVKCLLICAFAGMFTVFVARATYKSEENECLSWQNQALNYSLFYLVKWQDDQCKAHGIIINVPLVVNTK